jgi:hypothetical protein
MDLTVIVNDEKSGGYEFNEDYFATIDAWARAHCTSYQGYHVQDVQDVSLQWDDLAQYRFGDEQDLVIFRLKWL